MSAKRTIHITAGAARLEGELALPALLAGKPPLGVVLFAHGSGSSRHSPRNQFVARELERHGIGTLLIDLLTVDEDRDYERRFDIALLTQRLGDAARWLRAEASTKELAIGLFGASTGAAAALQLAARLPREIGAVVSRGGRPDLAGAQALHAVRAPTLLIVGGNDFGVIELNEAAYDQLTCNKQLEIVPHATHLFEEPGTLEAVARLASAWFVKHLTTTTRG